MCCKCFFTIWEFKPSKEKNFTRQVLHWKGFWRSLSWIIICFLRFHGDGNLLWHSLHVFRASASTCFLCFRSWLNNFLYSIFLGSSLKILPQSEHSTQSFWCLWLDCLWSFICFASIFWEHILHLNKFSPSAIGSNLIDFLWSRNFSSLTLEIDWFSSDCSESFVGKSYSTSSS